MGSLKPGDASRKIKAKLRQNVVGSKQKSSSLKEQVEKLKQKAKKQQLLAEKSRRKEEELVSSRNDDQSEEDTSESESENENGTSAVEETSNDKKAVSLLSKKEPKQEDQKKDQEKEDLNEGEQEEKEAETFAELGLIPALCEACSQLKFTKPTAIQSKAIPHALKGKDIIGIAQTGSGKTAAFALPIIQALWENPSPLFACVLAPTRELAYQISEQFESLGSLIGLRCTVIVGGMDMMQQALALSKKPHVIVATPGRLMDHLEHTKGFSLRTLKFLVMDEADRLLDMDFGPSLDKILRVIPKERTTYLFSATMTSKVEKLQRASLANPVCVAVSDKFSTVDTLIQSYIFFPFKHKDTYMIYLLNELAGNSIIVFTRTVNDCQRLAIMARSLGFPAIPLNGQLSQSARLGALNKFKSGSRQILIATDVAARGLDIPLVDVVVNYDIPTDSKAYIHRVGRTARAGRSGKSISLVTQYDLELYLRIESVLGKKLPEYEIDKDAVMLLSERVGEAQRQAIFQMKEMHSGKGRGGRRSKRNKDDMDKEEK